MASLPAAAAAAGCIGGIIRRVAVLGAGGWGTALAVHLARAGHDACLWGRDAGARGRHAAPPRQCGLPARHHVSRSRFASRPISTKRCATPNSSSPPCRRTARATSLRRAAPFVRRGATVVSATKGLEQDTLFRMSEVIEQELGEAVRVAVLSGPELRGRARARAADGGLGRVPRCRASSNGCRQSFARPTSGCTARAT